MVSHIFLDKISLSYHGGVEKNALKIQQNLKQKYSNLSIIDSWRDFFTVLRFIIFNRRISVNYFTFKGAAFRCLLITLLFPRVKLFIRVNNSPEAYLFWRGLRSLISFGIRIFLLKRNNVYLIFNSKAVMDFYISAMVTQNYIYLPNFYDETHRTTMGKNASSKIFAASRLSPEKRYNLTLKIFSSIDRKVAREINYYSSSKIDQELTGSYLVRNYDALRIYYNDVYVSLSAFEGMPNMAIEALLSGAYLVLSNCWAHTEIKEFAGNFDLASRIIILETVDQKHVEEVILSMPNTYEANELEEVTRKLLNMEIALKREFFGAFEKICKFIDD